MHNNRREGGLYSKHDLVYYISKKLGTTQVDTGVWCTAIFDSIQQAILEGRDVKLGNLGFFIQRDVPERNCRFADDRQYVVPAHRDVKFRVAKKLRDGLKDVPLIGSEEFDDDEDFED